MKRKQALKDGLKHYFTGKPCIRDHIANRSSKDGVCIECAVAHTRKWQMKNSDHNEAIQKMWREGNPDYERNWRKNNLEKIRKNATNYYKNNSEKMSNWYKNWYKNNPEKVKVQSATYRKMFAGKVNARTAKRRADKLNRTPMWLTKKDWKNIDFFYECCPTGCEVDHIIPLNGKNISGLHVPENLQWLTKLDNLHKGNNF